MDVETLRSNLLLTSDHAAEGRYDKAIAHLIVVIDMLVSYAAEAQAHIDYEGATGRACPHTA